MFTHPGRYHTDTQSANEDHCAAYSGDALAVSVLCDGAGGAGAGGEAAKVVSELLAGILRARFSELYYCEGSQARAVIVRLVTDALREYSLETGTGEQELACTILASAMDREGRCICFHLGDGIILQREQGEMRVVSPPMNGLVPGSTYLTMNCDMWRHLRYYRWQSPDTAQLLMLSDGAAEHLVRREPGTGWKFLPESSGNLGFLEAWLLGRDPWDDYSVASLSQTTKN